MNTIQREHHTKNFSIVPNVIFKSGLSLRAVGLLTYILHLPDDWVLYKSYLYENMPKDGRDAIKTAWRELEDKGYIETVKSGTTSRGKLPEINYIVYDIPRKPGGFQSAENPRSITRPSETRPLLSTKKLRTKKQSTNVSLLSNDNNEPPVSTEKIKAEKPQEKPPPNEKKQTTYQAFIAIYDTWFKKFNDGIPPNYANGNGNAAKAIINYIRTIVSQKAKAANEMMDDGALDCRLLESWELILKNWSKLEPFLQNKTRLVDINSNIQTIIQQVRNGKQKTGKQATGGDVSMDEIARSINAVYSKT